MANPQGIGIPQEIFLIIKSIYNNFTCKVGSNEISFYVKTGVRQGCCMSPLLFNLTRDWVMRQMTKDKRPSARDQMDPLLTDT